jgi:hypothetical protein
VNSAASRCRRSPREPRSRARFWWRSSAAIVSKWPGGIYSRAWIRAYAEAISLDPDDIVARFNECFARTAFPDGHLAPAVRPDAVRQIAAPLRLTLEADPAEPMRRLKRQSTMYAVDVIIAILVATLISTLTVVEFWTMFAVAVLACHGVGLFGGGGSAAGTIDRAVRRYARPHDDGSEQAVAEAV